MDAQIGQTEKPQGVFIVYENLLFIRGEIGKARDWKMQEKVACKPASSSSLIITEQSDCDKFKWDSFLVIIWKCYLLVL